MLSVTLRAIFELAHLRYGDLLTVLQDELLQELDVVLEVSPGLRLPFHVPQKLSNFCPKITDI
eukprot:scaffold3340_cov255-Pinguiococcus_pyrenoidosus.AAC.1